LRRCTAKQNTDFSNRAAISPVEELTQLKNVNESERPVMDGQQFPGMISNARFQKSSDVPNLCQILGDGEFAH
jgi:hypothetical protein